jgi:signal transduction histidine kinase/CheY-like chemotaxis protein
LGVQAVLAAKWCFLKILALLCTTELRLSAHTEPQHLKLGDDRKAGESVVKPPAYWRGWLMCDTEDVTNCAKSLRISFLCWLLLFAATAWICWDLLAKTAAAYLMAFHIIVLFMMSLVLVFGQLQAARIPQRRTGLLLAVLQLLSVLSVSLWGAVLLLCIPKLHFHEQVLLSTLPAVAGAVVTTTVSAGVINLRVQLLAIFLPAVLAWLIVGGKYGAVMSAYLFALIVAYDFLGRHQIDGMRKRVRTGADLTRANALLEQTNITRTRQIVEASHDLRQPVHALGMMLDRIDVAAPPKELRKRIRDIRICVNMVTDMLTDLLDLSRLESGGYKAEVQPVQMSKILSEADVAYIEMAHRKNLQWVVPTTQAWVMSDPAMLRRVLNNLVSNAIKYTETGTVGLSCRQEGDILRLRVSDTGCGIPQDKRQMIFKEYVRLPGATHEPGTGIGLAVVKRMLDVLGHHISVWSRPGVGSHFEITLPLAAPMVRQEGGKERVMSEPLAGKLALLIENDAQILDMTAEVMSSWDVTVIACASLEEAFTGLVAARVAPDIVICDAHLGSSDDGLTCIEKIRRRYNDNPLPAILLTGDLTNDLQTRARKMEVRIAYKPVRPARLAHQMISALAHHQITEPAPLISNF